METSVTSAMAVDDSTSNTKVIVQSNEANALVLFLKSRKKVKVLVIEKPVTKNPSFN
jgi:hypothetical protein